MKKAFLAIAAVALLFATSCTKENNAPENPTLGDGEFLATIDEGAYPQNAPVVNDGISPKTTIDANRYVIWEAGDEIKINGSIYTTNTSGNTVVFAPSDPKETHKVGQTFHAFFPASIAGTGAAGVMPATQTFEEGKVSNLPMYAYSTDRQLTFHNLFAAIAVTAPSDVNVATIDIETTDNIALYGSFDVVSNGNGGYMAKMTQTVDDAHKKVTLDCNGLSSSTNTFYIAVPAATYNNLKVTVTTSTGSKLIRENTNQLAIKANKLHRMTFSKVENCFRLKANDAGATIKMSANNDVTGIPVPQLEYSTDGYYWTQYTLDSVLTMANVGDSVMIRALYGHTNTRFGKFGYQDPNTGDIDLNLNAGYHFVTNDYSKSFKVLGNIMTLLNGTNPPTDFGGESCVFAWLFYRVHIQDASGLLLPDVTAPYCYLSMLSKTDIEVMPALPALTLSKGCYYGMFVKADFKVTPSQQKLEFPATTLAEDCYRFMFFYAGTVHQTTMPDVYIKAPSITNTPGCLNCMFYSAHLMSDVYFSATSFDATSATGLFSCCAGLNYPVVYTPSNSNIEDVWSVMTAGTTYGASYFSYSKTYTPQ